jgi:hypothetical protein
MVEKKATTKMDQAIDLAYAQVNKESGITSMDLFVVGLGYIGVGLSLVNAPWAPSSLKVLGGTIVGTGVVAVIAISRKL